MITLNITKDRQHVDIDFPCLEEVLTDALKKIGVNDELDTKQMVSEVVDFEMLSLLEGREVDLDEINYLAKRLDAMTKKELDKFSVVAQMEGYDNPKDLINLTFNERRYTLIQNIEDMTAIGRMHTLTREMAIPADKSKDAEYAKIGRELIESGKGQWTEKGLLFINEDIPFEEVYKGETFPSFPYKVHLLEVEVEFLGAREYLYLPEEELAIKKALLRLGVDNSDNCNITMTNCNTCDGGYAELLDNLVSDEDIYDINTFAKRAERLEDVNMFMAVAEYADITSVKDAIALIEHLDEFTYIDGISDEYELGQHLVDYEPEYECADEVKDFINYRDFGKYISDEYNGKFVSEGFVYISSGRRLEDIIDKDMGMSFGGM